MSRPIELSCTDPNHIPEAPAMTETPLYPLSEFTPEGAAKVAEFEAAPTPPEDAEAALIEAAAAALAEDANAGSVFDPIDLDPELYEVYEEDREYFRGQARAALAVFRGQQDPAVQRVLGTPPYKEGDPDPTPCGADHGPFGLGKECGARDAEGWICTREARHPADWHIAGDGDEVCAIWPVVGQS